MITPADLEEAMNDYDKVLDQHVAGMASEDAVDDAKENVLDVAQALYIGVNGKIDYTRLNMDRPNGALAKVKNGKLVVTLRDPDNPDELRDFIVSA